MWMTSWRKSLQVLLVTPVGAATGIPAYDAQARLIEPLVQAGKGVVIPPISSRRHQRSY